MALTQALMNQMLLEELLGERFFGLGAYVDGDVQGIEALIKAHNPDVRVVSVSVPEKKGGVSIRDVFDCILRETDGDGITPGQSIHKIIEERMSHAWLKADVFIISQAQYVKTKDLINLLRGKIGHALNNSFTQGEDKVPVVILVGDGKLRKNIDKNEYVDGRVLSLHALKQ